jgi:hypothetical protein
METNAMQSKQSQAVSQTDTEAYFQAIKAKAAKLDETLIGRFGVEASLCYALELEAHKLTPADCWYGTNIRACLRLDEAKTKQAIKQLFKLMLLDMNVDHPWTTERMGTRQINIMLDFDHTWTLEDFVCFFDLAGRGRLANHYGRPSRAWIEEAQRAYNEEKAAAREEIARRAKVKAEADAMEAAYNAGLRLPTSEEHMQPARTMAEFLGGKSKLSFAEREAMKQRDQQRNG